MKKYKPTLTLADINWFKSEFIPELADAVQKRIESKLDDVSTKLDKFVGDIKTKREEQALHDENHERVDKRISRLEKTTHLPPYAD